jgi:RNA polymerase sigma-70 factor (ECF subfamily)
MVDWDGIIDREGPAVWRTVCRLLTDRADAEECFQETFLAALQLWRREPVRSPRAALRRLATARAIDALRRRYRAAGRESDEAPASAIDPAPRPPDRAAAAELAEALRVALAALPGKQAEAFCLHCLDGYSYREVGEELNLSVDAVGVLLHRARARLRDLLAARAPADPGAALEHAPQQPAPPHPAAR